MFLKATHKQKKEAYVWGMTTSWLGTHLSEKGYKEVISELQQTKSNTKKTASAEWNRLKTALTGLR